MSLHSRSQASDSKWQTGTTDMESAHKQKHVLKDEKTRTRRMHRRDVSNSRECDACAAPFSVVTFVRLPNVQKRGVSRWRVPIHSARVLHQRDRPDVFPSVQASGAHNVCGASLDECCPCRGVRPSALELCLMNDGGRRASELQHRCRSASVGWCMRFSTVSQKSAPSNAQQAARMVKLLCSPDNNGDTSSRFLARDSIPSRFCGVSAVLVLSDVSPSSLTKTCPCHGSPYISKL